ncbi:MAG TPA: hypothetical protein VK586_22365 [Streptosporangiaceae bacterium]|nr:hypothetical protein [Streptosporangiaceae bacterium]
MTHPSSRRQFLGHAGAAAAGVVFLKAGGRALAGRAAAPHALPATTDAANLSR